MLYPEFCSFQVNLQGESHLSKRPTLSFTGCPGAGSATGLALLHGGFALPCKLLYMRWALAPPFHPYPYGRFVFCGTGRQTGIWPCLPGFSAGPLPYEVRKFLCKIIAAAFLHTYILAFLEHFIFNPLYTFQLLKVCDETPPTAH